MANATRSREIGMREAERVEHLDTLAETSAKAISNIKFDKVVVWDSGNGGASALGFLQSMAKTLPPMMHVLRDIADVEIPGLAKLAADAGLADRPVVAGDDSAVTRRVTPELSELGSDSN